MKDTVQGITLHNMWDRDKNQKNEKLVLSAAEYTVKRAQERHLLGKSKARGGTVCNCVP